MLQEIRVSVNSTSTTYQSKSLIGKMMSTQVFSALLQSVLKLGYRNSHPAALWLISNSRFSASEAKTKLRSLRIDVEKRQTESQDLFGISTKHERRYVSLLVGRAPRQETKQHGYPNRYKFAFPFFEQIQPQFLFTFTLFQHECCHRVLT